MKDLNVVEIESVSGGSVAVLLGVLAFCYYERNNIADFIGGFLDGYGGLPASQ